MREQIYLSKILFLNITQRFSTTILNGFVSNKSLFYNDILNNDAINEA